MEKSAEGVLFQQLIGSPEFKAAIAHRSAVLKRRKDPIRHFSGNSTSALPTKINDNSFIHYLFYEGVTDMAKFLKIRYYIKKWIRAANELIAAIRNNEEVKWELRIIIISAACSAICAILTQNMILTAIYIGITAILDIISDSK